MKQQILLIATAAALLAPGTAGFAEPLDRKDVAAEPAFAFHVDFDALRKSSVGQAILNGQEIQDGLAELSQSIDFDLSKQLHGFTVYTTMANPRDGALIVYADFDTNKLLTLAKKADDFRTDTTGPHVIYSWQDQRRMRRADSDGRVYGAIMGNRVVFGQNPDRLAEALAVLDGKAPNLSKSDELPDAVAGTTNLVQGVLLKIDADERQRRNHPGNFNEGRQRPNAALFRLAKQARFRVSLTGDNLNADVRLAAEDADTANQMTTLAQGLVALMKLQQGNADAQKLANSIVVKQDGPGIELTVTEPSSTLIDMIKEGQEKEARRARGEDAPAQTPTQAPPPVSPHNHPNNFP